MKTEPKFNDIELGHIYGALQRTWSEIGSEAVADGTLSRAEVIELVLDADRARAHFKDQALYARFTALPYKELIEIAKGTFKFRTYGS